MWVSIRMAPVTSGSYRRRELIEPEFQPIFRSRRISPAAMTNRQPAKARGDRRRRLAFFRKWANASDWPAVPGDDDSLALFGARYESGEFSLGLSDRNLCAHRAA